MCVLCVCQGTSDGRMAQEMVVLACGHRMHLACWIPCVLPTSGSGSAQARFIEDRMGRKCPACRGEFSAELTDALKERRQLIRDVKSAGRVRQDPGMQRILRAMRAAGVANPLLAQLPGAEEELSSDPSLEPMPLDPGDLVTALSSPAGLGPDQAQEAARVLRSVLQKAGHSPSGQLPSLAGAVVEKRLATRGLFLLLRDKGLLTKAEPLHGMICAQLEPIEQRKVSGGEAERGAWAPEPVSPAGLDVAQALAGIAALAPPPPVALPPPPAYDAEVAQ